MVLMLLTRVRNQASTSTPALERMRVQLSLGLGIGVIIPFMLVLAFTYNWHLGIAEGTKNSTIAALMAVILAVVLFRRVTSFPGIRAFRYVLPTYAGAFGIVLTVILALRIDYSRPLLGLSFLLSLAIAVGSALIVLRYGVRRFYVVPFGRYDAVFRSPNAEWVIMSEPRIPDDPTAIIVADLRYDHEQAWEQMLAHAAVAGYPVYHIKQLRESLTGQVSIEHISENSFGSLLPNLAYRKVKRFIDIVTAIILTPFFILPFLIVALLIKIDSPGPVFFRQERMGYRGRPFRIFKFRTMRVQSDMERQSGEHGERGAAVTGENDPRITRLGRFFRRTRIDELPQILNIIVGEMSWIGPRPEAVALSQWYEEEIPFYFYRHIVRPGITGWAQVNQGHVADIQAVSTKLGYDFYYIQNFSAWLDVLITLRTVSTMLSGFGAR
ncbi:MAG: exopolysaccharide biosynthesis polyprenyl glycosylphosphotransferase [Oxalobacteraceae bacterium]|nr:MAG: exopolysaccharide biosynthesis polyprenyl glycosylphosphotransferase [Oxalobacteraceae bacterium]